MAKISEAKMKANRKWNEANYHRVALVIPITWRDELQQYAINNKTSINSLLNHYIATLLGKVKDTNTSAVKDTNTSADKKKKRMPSPTAKMVAEWQALRNSGIKDKDIAEKYGYTADAVRKRLKKGSA